MAHPALQLKQTDSGKYYFTLTDTNGQTLMHSEAYGSKDGCENGMDTFKNNAPTAKTDDLTGDA